MNRAWILGVTILLGCQMQAMDRLKARARRLALNLRRKAPQDKFSYPVRAEDYTGLDPLLEAMRYAGFGVGQGVVGKNREIE